MANIPLSDKRFDDLFSKLDKVNESIRKHRLRNLSTSNLENRAEQIKKAISKLRFELERKRKRK